MRRICWISTLAALLAASTAVAAEPPPILAKPGDTVIVPIEAPADYQPNYANLIGRDANGTRGYFVSTADGPQLHLVAPDETVKKLGVSGDQGIYGGVSWDRSRFVLLMADAQAWHLITVDASQVTDGADLPAPTASFPKTGVPELTAPVSAEQKVGLVALPDGAACLIRDEGLVCLDPATTPSVQWRIDVASLGDQVPTPAEYVASVVEKGKLEPEAITWEVALATPMPDGRVAALVRQELAGKVGTQTIFTKTLSIVAAGETGPVEVLFGPVPEVAANAVSTWTPLRNASQLLWFDDLQAVGALVRNWDIGGSNRSATAAGWFGHGLLLVPSTGDGHGYLSLSDAVNVLRPASNTTSIAPLVALSRAPDGWTVRIEFRIDPANSTVVWGRLQWDVATMDLDADGLRVAEEAALGTSDFRADTDGGGTLDGVEARLEGTDPIDWRDDGALIHAEARKTWLIDSPLVRLRLPEVGAGFRAARTWSTAGPICVEGACYASDGSVVVRYPHANAGRFVSFDGRFMAMSDGDGIDRIWFEDGRVEPWIDAAELRGASPNNDYDVYEILPVDARRVFVRMFWSTAYDFAAAIVYCEDGDCRLAFDPMLAREEAGIEQGWWASEDLKLHDVYPNRVELLGWDPVHEQALVQALGPLDAWILALPTDGDPYVLERARTWTAGNLPIFDGLPILERVGVTLPDWMVWQPEGDFWTPKGLVSPARRFLPTGISLTAHLARPPASGWGDTMIDSICCGAREDGVYETVRYERVVEPGDALVLRLIGDDVVGGAGYQLFRSGPRGGLLPLWPTVNKDIVDVGDMDATAEGDLCVADKGKETLWVFAPAKPDDRVPELVVAAPDVPGILDCLWDQDNPGDVLMLVHDKPNDPRLMRYDGDTGEVVPEERPWLELPPDPRILLRKPDGSLEVAGHDIRGKAYAADGREVVVPKDRMAVVVDGQEVTGLRLATVDFSTPLNPAHPVYADVAVRPDGLVIVIGEDNQQGLGVITEPWAVDPKTGDDVLLGIDRLGNIGGGLAIVPGGVAADPWTGAPVGDGASTGPDPSGPTVPTPPEEAGEPLPGGGGSGDGGGCDAGHGSPPWWALFMLPLWMVRRRRRRQTG